jgi:hypothetical protein
MIHRLPFMIAVIMAVLCLVTVVGDSSIDMKDGRALLPKPSKNPTRKPTKKIKKPSKKPTKRPTRPPTTIPPVTTPPVDE